VQSEIAALQEKIKQSRLKMKDIENFKEQKETLAKKMDIIASLDKNKAGPVRMLDEISTSLPGNLWLTKLDQKGGELVLEGSSLDNLSVSRSMLQLESSAHFNEIILLEVKTDTRATVGSTPLKNFKMRSQVTYNVDG
jgi:type IV pilus assembly protein PilN